MSNKLSTSELEDKAVEIRRSIVQMLEKAGSGHSAGPLGMADILTALYFRILKHDPTDPEWDGRDIFLLSNGHTAPVLYAAMAHSGYFPLEELDTLRRYGSRLQGHPERVSLPGLENTSGPLGSGLSQAAGFAYVLQHIDPDPQRFVYVMMGDGELNEGNIWEAAMFAGKYRLKQLIGFVDRNNIQIDGATEDVMPLEDLRGKWESFGWHVLEVDGHNMQAILDAVSTAKAVTYRPTVIIAHTIPGKGVPFMEYDYRWHGKAPDGAQLEQALNALALTTPKGSPS
ncbi:transketolase [Microbacterium sp. AK031]|uniref:transketolase n=1 Tax=Microbacterium sp. AK031 TaxID=2723076 RepID=UPI00216948BA|nr:transketolase [Microbacterium sp. AK031]MCS3843386.1 transketolase [Microbacterium sp. AK031]